FLRFSNGLDAAEDVAEAHEQRTRVGAQGRLKQGSLPDREGHHRTSIELDDDQIGPSLKYAPATANQVQRGGEGRRRHAGGPATRAPAAATRAATTTPRSDRCGHHGTPLTHTIPRPRPASPQKEGAPRWPSLFLASRRRSRTR